MDVPDPSPPLEPTDQNAPESSFNYPIFGEASAVADAQQDEPGEQETANEPVEERRGFIKFLCVFFGTLISMAPFSAGLWSYLNP